MKHTTSLIPINNQTQHLRQPLAYAPLNATNSAYWYTSTLEIFLLPLWTILAKQRNAILLAAHRVHHHVHRGRRFFFFFFLWTDRRFARFACHSSGRIILVLFVLPGLCRTRRPWSDITPGHQNRKEQYRRRCPIIDYHSCLQ